MYFKEGSENEGNESVFEERWRERRKEEELSRGFQELCEGNFNTELYTRERNNAVENKYIHKYRDELGLKTALMLAFHKSELTTPPRTILYITHEYSADYCLLYYLNLV